MCICAYRLLEINRHFGFGYSLFLLCQSDIYSSANNCVFCLGTSQYTHLKISYLSSLNGQAHMFKIERERERNEKKEGHISIFLYNIHVH